MYINLRLFKTDLSNYKEEERSKKIGGRMEGRKEASKQEE